MKKKIEKGISGKFVARYRSALGISLAAGLFGCAAPHASDEAATADEDSATPVTIYYDDDSCPTVADPIIVSLNKGDKVRWESSDGSTPFKIYFSPFAGDPISGSNGKTPKQTIAQQPPAGVVYKYTIVADDCTDKPLDPFVRVTH